MLASAGGLDPTFAGGTGTSLIALKANTPALSGLYDLTQVKVESDGSIVAAGPVDGGASIGIIHLLADGTRDTSFGATGEVDLPNPTGTFKLLLQAGTKIVVFGTSLGGSTAAPFVARYHTDGTPDTTFGTGGTEVLNQATLGVSGLVLIDAAVQGDNKIVLVGNSPVPSSPTITRFTAIRLTVSGALDTSFGTAGEVTDAHEGGSAGLVAIQPNGQILITGSLPDVIRLNADGSQDTSFLQTGLQSAGVGAVYDLGVQPDGDIVVLGLAANTTDFPNLALLNANGSFQAANTTTGINVLAGQLGIQDDGKIIVSGAESANFAVYRFNANLTLDSSFGTGGYSYVTITLPPPTSGGTPVSEQKGALTVGPGNQIILVGSNPGFHIVPTPATYLAVAKLTSKGASAKAGDFDGDGISDPAIYLPAAGDFAIAYSSGIPSQLIPFGGPGLGTAIPAAGNYGGTGQQEIGAYLPGLGIYAYRPASGPDVYYQLGSAGNGLTIPAPGDYYGTGQDDVAVYLADLGAFAVVDPTGATSGEVVSFGRAGVGNAIPVPGDYFGTGKTDFAVYLPAFGSFEIQKPDGTSEMVSMGIPGVGTSLPVPGYYDGSGKLELAVYLPSYGVLVYRPADSYPDVVIPFGGPGAGTVLPMPGDYTGSGQTDPAVYIPALGELAYRPPTGPDVYFKFGSPGLGQTIPVTTVVLTSAEVGLSGSGSGGTVFALSVPNAVGGLETPGSSASKKAKLGDVTSWETPALI